MVDENTDFEPNLFTASMNFVDSLFNEEDNSNALSQDTKSSKGSAIQKSKKNKTKELNLKNNNLNEKKNSSKANFKPKNKCLMIKTTGKKKLITTNNSNNKLLVKEKTTKSNASNTSNFYTQSTPNIEYALNSDRNHYSMADINVNSSAYDLYKANKQSYRDKRLYTERVKLLQNHINALKKQEEQLNKKAEINREREKKNDKRKQEKENLKQALLSLEIDKRNELEEKKKNILEQKMKNNLGLKESLERNHKKKMQNYQKAYNDKKKVETERIENKNKKEANNHMLFIKLKNEREKNKESYIRKKNENKNRLNTSYKLELRNNVDETKRLKNEISRLELMEIKYIEHLNKTRDSIENNNKNNSSQKRLANSAKRRYCDKNKKTFNKNQSATKINK